MHIYEPSQITTLTSQEKEALVLLRQKLGLVFRVKDIIIFGSKARGDFTEDSDLDVLVLVEEEKSWQSRELLSDIVYEINMQFDTQLTCIMENVHQWQSEDDSIWLPLKDNIVEEGIVLALS